MPASRKVRRVAECRGLIALILAVAALVLISQPATADEFTQPKLAQLVRDAIKNKTVWFDPPRVTIFEQNLGYSPGRLFYPDYAHKPVQPLGFPVDLQFKVELIRAFRAGERDELAFLQPYLAEIEKIVVEELALVAQHRGDAEQLLELLSERHDRGNEILMNGIRQWASQKGLTFGEAESFSEAVFPTVKFRIKPAGGTVYYLNAVDYNVYKAAGVLNQVDRWNQVPGEQMEMGGTYYFRATWPGGKSRETAKILINQEQTISLQAD
jgi:hypothetical protein